MVAIAQLVEHRVVVAGVAGSSPVSHPNQRGPTRRRDSGAWGLALSDACLDRIYDVLVPLTIWFSLLTASVVISFTPGAGAINTMSNALKEGWRRSLWGVIGQQLALIVHIVIVAAGVG